MNIFCKHLVIYSQIILSRTEQNNVYRIYGVMAEREYMSKIETIQNYVEEKNKNEFYRINHFAFTFNLEERPSRESRCIGA